MVGVCHGRVSHLRAFLADRTPVARIPVSTLKMFKASDCGRPQKRVFALVAGGPYDAPHPTAPRYHLRFSLGVSL